MDQAQRPWGEWQVLADADGYKVKRLQVAPRHRLSLQTHLRRSEHWVCVAGAGSCIIGSVEHALAIGDALHVPEGVQHRIANDGDVPLVIVEVQIGDYTEEDDIIRHDDDYERASEPR